MKRTILPALLLTFIFLFLLSPLTQAAEHFSVREYEEFHDALHPLEHEALPQGDFKRIRAEAPELVKRGEVILKLGVPAGVKEEYKTEFTQELKKFGDALSRFRTDAEKGTDAQLKESYSAVHDSFEMLAALLPPLKKGS
jgi:hypothetical protein